MGGFNNFMTLTSYVFGVGILIFALRNPNSVVTALSGVWNAGLGVVKGIGGL